MKRIKVMVVFGTRPEAIKMAPLVKQLQVNPYTIPVVCVTAQHRQMLDQVLEAFAITPDYDLNIMKAGQSLGGITARVLEGLEPILQNEQPDILLVHGDTTTTLAGALAAFYQQIPIGHVESGLRTYNLQSPFPEEANRTMVSILANWHFAPTETAKRNLLREHVKESNILVTGNTAIDALATTVHPDYHHSLFDWLGNDRLLLLTAHRRENLGEKMEQMFRAIRRVVEEVKDVKVVYPVHLNPQVRAMAQKVFQDHPRIRLIEPLEVVDFHNIMAKSDLILTDSGGIQEEAPSLGIPVLVLRDTTERPEGVEAGTLRLIGTQEEPVYQAIMELLQDIKLYLAMSHATNPYGDGHASERIVDCIVKTYGKP